MLVALLHGFAQTAYKMQLYAGLETIKDIEFVYPDSYYNWLAKPSFYTKLFGNRDVKMLDKLAEKTDKFVVGGYSDGADMANYYGCLQSEKVAGVITYGGDLLIPTIATKHKFPILIAGNKDDYVRPAKQQDKLADRWIAAGHQVTRLVGTGTHMDMWDKNLNTEIIAWLNNL